MTINLKLVNHFTSRR